VVPPGAAFQLETTTGSGSVEVDVGGFTHDGEDFRGPVGGGGPFAVRASTTSGSIAVIERAEP
jgi:DUF4097 and DUF4098 domain-containing protein YvlB